VSQIHSEVYALALISMLAASSVGIADAQESESDVARCNKALSVEQCSCFRRNLIQDHFRIFSQITEVRVRDDISAEVKERQVAAIITNSTGGNANVMMALGASLEVAEKECPGAVESAATPALPSAPSVNGLPAASVPAAAPIPTSPVDKAEKDRRFRLCVDARSYYRHFEENPSRRDPTGKMRRAEQAKMNEYCEPHLRIP
jgi:hypothetical protein